MSKPLILLAFCFLLFYSCGLQEVKEAEPVLNPVKKNQSFFIALQEDHSKGETWQMVKDVNTAAFENLGSNWHGPEKGVRFNLKALKSGIYELSFEKTKMVELVEMRTFIILVDGN